MSEFNLSGIGMTSQRTRDRLVERLREQGINNEAVLAQIAGLPRHIFIDEALAHRAYEDTALPIGHGQTISQPFVVALMTQLLLDGRAAGQIGRGVGQTERAAGQIGRAAGQTERAVGQTERAAGEADPQRRRVLEVGTGCGYQTAVLAGLCAEVYSIERIEAFIAKTRRRFTALKLRNISVRFGDGYEGWPRFAPFDGILVAAAPAQVPEQLLEQLAVGGRMVLPVGGDNVQELRVIDRLEDGFEETVQDYVRFVPLKKGIA